MGQTGPGMLALLFIPWCLVQSGGRLQKVGEGEQLRWDLSLTQEATGAVCAPRWGTPVQYIHPKQLFTVLIYL